MELWGLVGKATKPGNISYSFAWFCADQHERTRAKLNSRAVTRRNSRGTKPLVRHFCVLLLVQN